MIQVAFYLFLVGLGVLIGLTWGNDRAEDRGLEMARERVGWCRACWDYRHNDCSGPPCMCNLTVPARHLELLDQGVANTRG